VTPQNKLAFLLTAVPGELLAIQPTVSPGATGNPAHSSPLLQLKRKRAQGSDEPANVGFWAHNLMMDMES